MSLACFCYGRITFAPFGSCVFILLAGLSSKGKLRAMPGSEEEAGGG